MRAPSKIKNILSVALVLAFGIFLTACAATKITDPADPRFNPEQFRFEDYKDDRDLRPALEKLFPVGTDKQFIEKTLVESAGASIRKVPFRENDVLYIYGKGKSFIKCSYGVRAIYDTHDSLAEKIKVNFGCSGP